MVISACKATKAGGAIFLKSAHVTGWPEGVMMQCQRGLDRSRKTGFAFMTIQNIQSLG